MKSIFSAKFFSTSALVMIFIIIATICVVNHASFPVLYWEYVIGIIITGGAHYHRVHEKHPGIFWCNFIATMTVPLIMPAYELLSQKMSFDDFTNYTGSPVALPFTFWGLGTIGIAFLIPFAGMAIAKHVKE